MSSMSSNITWQFQATIPGGPALTLKTPDIPFQGYDVVALTIPASTKNVHVDIQPTAGAGDVIFLVVSSSEYDAGVSYKVDDIATSHALDGPHVLLGSGAVNLLHDKASPTTLIFDNNLTKEIKVQVVVGRNLP
jgi:hypothetical protein